MLLFRTLKLILISVLDFFLFYNQSIFIFLLLLRNLLCISVLNALTIRQQCLHRSVIFHLQLGSSCETIFFISILDINECLINNGGCATNGKTHCVNYPGSFVCRCAPGYILKDNSLIECVGMFWCLFYYFHEKIRSEFRLDLA